MMYNEKLVVVIKANGRVLRETNGTVYIPFGQEYSIQIKNLHTEKAVVSIDIDGDNVTDGSRYIIHPGDTVEVEGFLKGNDITRKFKFIEKTEEISDFRGDQMEDGLVKLTYQFEKRLNFTGPTVWYSNNTLNKKYGSRDSGSPPDVDRSFSSSINCCYNSHSDSVIGCSLGNAVASASVSNDAGITGKGSKSNQSFSNGWVGLLEDTLHTMVIQLKGGVQAPITVKTKLQCDLCGRKWPSKNQFCGSCGNALR